MTDDIITTTPQEEPPKFEVIKISDREIDVTQPLPPEYSEPGKYRWMKTGHIVSTETSKIVSAKYAIHYITKQNSRDLRKAQEEKILRARLAAAEGMAIALKGDSALSLEAWGSIVGSQAQHAINWDSPNTASSSVRAAEFVGRAAGLLSDPRARDSDPTHDAAAAIGSAFIRELASRLNIIDDDDTIDAEWE